MDKKIERLGPQATEWSLWDYLFGGGRDGAGGRG